jgi:hypothetical protein
MYFKLNITQYYTLSQLDFMKSNLTRTVFCIFSHFERLIHSKNDMKNN